jgi:predicted regulator of Ras-like GTPase activity (Roadblock/LC7/MglB family)
MTTYDPTSLMSEPTSGASDPADGLAWLIDRFVQETAGVSDAVAVSSDGLLMGASSTLDRAGAERLGALIAGFTSLGRGATQAFGFQRLEHVMISMDGGFLIVAAVKNGSCLGVLARRDADVGLIGHQVSVLTDRVGTALTPDLVNQPGSH